jgi:MFS family permease
MMDLEEILSEYSKRLNFKQLFLRDMAITARGFLYFLISFIFSAISINFIIASILSYSGSLNVETIYATIIFMILFSVLFGGFLIDFTKNRVKLIVFSSLGALIGMFFCLFDEIFMLIGLALVTFFTGIFLIDLIVILFHESNILNRGRLLGYSFFLSFIISHLFITFTINYVFIIFLVQLALTTIFFGIARGYKYIETKERLKNSVKFNEIFGSLHITGYFFAVLTLAFVIGNSYNLEFGLNIITPLFVILFIGSFLISGISMDNLGRKWTFAASVLIISAIILFAKMINNHEIYISIFFGVTVPTLFMIIFTFTGDFSTERHSIRYRGRLLSLFLIALLGGFIFGLLANYSFTHLYLRSPTLFFWVPAFLEGLKPFLLILLLVWIIPLPEILTARESDWKNSLKNIYVFNTASVCLYSLKFGPESEGSSVLSEDLIAGGFSGILSLLSEITNEQKNLRIIDKQGVKIYFSYGKSIIIALIATKNLPILFKKLELFTKAFEKKFEKELVTFRGKINPFQDASKLILKYFN